MNKLYRDGQFKCFLAKDFNEACTTGLFSGSMSMNRLRDSITRYNKRIDFFFSKDHCALWDRDKGEKGFICGIPNLPTIPKYSIMEYNFGKDRKLQYTDMNGEYTGEEEIINKDEFEYKVLARGWETIFAICEKQGYKVDRRNI